MPRSLLELYYNQSSYEPLSGGGYGISNNKNKTLGKQTSGSPRQYHVYDIENSMHSIEDDESEEVDDDDILSINAKIGASQNVHRNDPGHRKDNATLATNNHTSIFEYSGDHKNYAVKGLSPKLTYRSKTNTKGPALGTQASATYIRNKPGRKSGTQYGTSRPHKLLTAIEDESIFNLDDMLDQIERSMVRHNRETKEIISIVKEYIE